MRIAFLSDADAPWGAEQSLATLLLELAKHDGAEPIVFAHNEDVLDACAGESGIEREQVKIHSGSAPRVLRWSHGLSAKQRQRLAAADVAVVFSISLAPLPLLTRRLGTTTAAFDLHDHLPTWTGRAKLRTALARYDGILAVSKFAARQGPRRVPTTVMTRPIAAPLEAGFATAPAAMCGLVGRIDPDKGLPLAVEAVRRLGAPFSLSVRGAPSPGWEEWATTAQTEAIGVLGGRVEFNGRVPHSQALAGLGALIVANAREALGRTVLEAQLAYVPVVVPNAGGPSELVIDGVTGYVYQAGSSASLADALRRSSAHDRTVLEAARASAARATDPATYANSYLDFLSILTAKGRSR